MTRPGTLAAALSARPSPPAAATGVTAPPPPPAPTPVTTVIFEGSFNGLPPDGAVMATFQTTGAGDLEFVVDWTFASNDVGLILFRGVCSEEQLLAEQCDIADVAESPTAKPERVAIADAPAGTYTLVVLNLGETEESFSYQVLLTTVGSASEGRARASAVRADPRWRLARARPASWARLP